MNDVLRVPGIDTTDPASLEAFFGGFGFFDYWRKVVLSNCREIERAEAASSSTKVSESRLDDLAHTHPNYLSFLTEGLEGRRIR